jgi:hypothetical protein
MTRPDFHFLPMDLRFRRRAFLRGPPAAGSSAPPLSTKTFGPRIGAVCEDLLYEDPEWTELSPLANPCESALCSSWMTNSPCSASQSSHGQAEPDRLG